MQKKVIVFSMLALSVLLWWCWNSTSNTNEIDLWYKVTEWENITWVKEFDNDSITKEDESDNTVTKWFNDRWVIDSLSNESL